MNDLQTNTIADQLLDHIRSVTADPSEGLVVLGILNVKFYSAFVSGQSIEAFTAGFRRSMIAAHADMLRGSAKLQ